MFSFWQDLRYAARTMGRARGFAAIAIVSLAIGIGANTTVFSVYNVVRFRRLPFRDPDRLVAIWETSPERGVRQRTPAFATLQAIREQNRSFELLGMLGGAQPVTLGEGETEKVLAGSTDAYIFDVLGVRPALGRTFAPDDAPVTGRSSPIILSHKFWKTRLGGTPDVLQRTVRIGGGQRTIIGVMPERFWLDPWDADVAFWECFDLSNVPRSRWMAKIGRLKPGVSLEEAEAATTPIVRSSEQALGGDIAGLRARVASLREAYFGELDQPLVFLLGTVAFVLLIACGNVANLLLARGAERRSELTIRAALGADRQRIVRQLLAESGLLSIAGGSAGVLLALWGNSVFAALAPRWGIGITQHIELDLRVLGFTALISLVTTFVFGLWPALAVSRVDLNESLKSGRSAAGKARARGRSLLMVAEVALAMVMLSGAGILIQGLIINLSAHPGFNAYRVLTGRILLEGEKYFSVVPGDLKRVTPQAAAFYGRLLDQIRAIPGVVSAGMISRLPTDGTARQPFTILGRPPLHRGTKQEVDYLEVDSSLFRTLDLAVVRGRGIDERDVEGSPWVMVVNRTFAERYFPGEDPLGKAIRISIHSDPANVTVPEEQPREIVGVVDNIRYPSWETEPVAAAYVSYRQHPREYPGGDHWVHIGKTLVIRTAVAPMSLAPALRRALAEIDRNQVLEAVMTAEQRIAESLDVYRFVAQLFGGLGTLALLLAAVGLFGVTSYLVNQRTPEFGIRIALGARRGNIVRLIALQLGLLLGAGTVLGAAGGYAIQAMLRRGLDGLPPAGALMWFAVVFVMVGMALLATWLPLQRAMRTDPIVALRYE